MLKRALCRNPILQHPDFSKIFSVTTDSSDYALSAVITQETDEMYLLVAYFSRTLVGAEVNYDSTQKECQAVITALENFRPYLYGKKIILSCDHESLKITNDAIKPTT